MLSFICPRTTGGIRSGRSIDGIEKNVEEEEEGGRARGNFSLSREREAGFIFPLFQNTSSVSEHRYLFFGSPLPESPKVG